jgi:hypothetical protein
MKMLSTLAESWEERGSYRAFADTSRNLGTVYVTLLGVPNTAIYRHHHSRDCGKEQERLLYKFLVNFYWLHRQTSLMLCFSLMRKEGLIFVCLFAVIMIYISIFVTGVFYLESQQQNLVVWCKVVTSVSKLVLSLLTRENAI